MADDLCEFSLIFPEWLGPAIAFGGLLLAIVASVVRRRAPTVTTADGDVKLKIGPVEFAAGWPVTLVFLGIFFVLLAVGVVATRYKPFGRWVGSTMSFVVDTKDAAVSAQLDNESMESIESNLGYAGRYVVQLSRAAKRERVAGSYTDNRCYAELITRICRQESQRLECKMDPDKRVIRVCHKPDDAECADK
jgi:hypothetical protein